MKRVITFIVALCTLFGLGGNLKAKAWGTTTHVEITNNALEMLRHDDSTVYKFLTNNFSIQDLRKGSIDPDWTDKKIGSHFYIYNNGEKNKGQYYKGIWYAFFVGTHDTARTLLEKEYDEAINYYNMGNKEDASLHLGRAIHFMQDICCTLHTSGVCGKKHAEIETYIDKISNDEAFYATGAEKSMYDNMVNNDIGVVVNESAKLSSSWEAKMTSGDDVKIEEAYSKTCKLSQVQTAALIYKFIKDVQK